jgi:hypothetical protein
VATILFSTIVITLSISVEIKLYFKRQSENKHSREYYNGLFMANTVYIAITRNYASTEYDVKTFSVLSKIVNPISDK